MQAVCFSQEATVLLPELNLMTKSLTPLRIYLLFLLLYKVEEKYIPKHFVGLAIFKEVSFAVSWKMGWGRGRLSRKQEGFAHFLTAQSPGP